MKPTIRLIIFGLGVAGIFAIFYFDAMWHSGGVSTFGYLTTGIWILLTAYIMTRKNQAAEPESEPMTFTTAADKRPPEREKMEKTLKEEVDEIVRFAQMDGATFLKEYEESEKEMESAIKESEAILTRVKDFGELSDRDRIAYKNTARMILWYKIIYDDNILKIYDYVIKQRIGERPSDAESFEIMQRILKDILKLE